MSTRAFRRRTAKHRRVSAARGDEPRSVAVATAIAHYLACPVESRARVREAVQAMRHVSGSDFQTVAMLEGLLVEIDRMNE